MVHGACTVYVVTLPHARSRSCLVPSSASFRDECFPCSPPKAAAMVPLPLQCKPMKLSGSHSWMGFADGGLSMRSSSE